MNDAPARTRSFRTSCTPCYGLQYRDKQNVTMTLLIARRLLWNIENPCTCPPVETNRPRIVPSGSARDGSLSIKRPPPPRMSSGSYHADPRPTSGPKCRSGAAIIQPATTQRERRPSVTARRMSYSEPQDHRTSVGAGDRSNEFAPGVMYSRATNWQPTKHIVDSSRVDNELPNVPPKSMNSIRHGPLSAVIMQRSLEDASVVSKNASPRVLAAPSAVVVDSINKSTPHTTTKQRLQSSDDESLAFFFDSAALRISGRLDSPRSIDKASASRSSPQSFDMSNTPMSKTPGVLVETLQDSTSESSQNLRFSE